MQWIPLDKLYVESYGRPLNLARVEKMAQDWDPQAAGNIIVSLRTDLPNAGKYAILDGTHRAGAARRRGIDGLLCIVLTGLTHQREAELFNLLNTVSNPTTLDRFRAKVEAQDAMTMHIVAIAHRHGLQVAITGPGPARIQAVGALEKIYVDHGWEMLDRVLGYLHAGFGTTSARSYSQPALMGLAAFLARYGNQVDVRRLIDRLVATGPDGMLQRAELLRKALSEAPGISWGKALLIIYNNGLREHRLSEWPERMLTARVKKSRAAGKQD